MATPAVMNTTTTIPPIRATLLQSVPLPLSPADAIAPVDLRPVAPREGLASNAELMSATEASRVLIGCRPKRCSMVAITDVVSCEVWSTAYFLRSSGELTIAGMRVPGAHFGATTGWDGGGTSYTRPACASKVR